jgi:hypothetical protein
MLLLPVLALLVAALLVAARRENDFLWDGIGQLSADLLTNP